MYKNEALYKEITMGAVIIAVGGLITAIGTIVKLFDTK